MTILGIDHVEFYVADLEKAAAALCRGFGFRMPCAANAVPGDPGGAGGADNVGEAGGADNVRDAGGADNVRDAGGAGGAGLGGRSLLLRQGRIKLVLTAASSPGHPAADFVQRHGDGVASIAFRTDDVREEFAAAVAGGAAPISGPALARREDRVAEEGLVCQAVVSGFGDVTHRLVERDGPAAGEDAGEEEPAQRQAQRRDDELLEAVDHAAICLLPGELEAVVRFYRDAFGFAHTFDERIEVGGQAMVSKVIQDRTGAVTFTLLEPDPDRKPGQIDQFLSAHGGAGVQHLALRTPDIVGAVRALSERGIEFLTAPAGYYRSLEGRLGACPIPVEVLRDVNVLADRDQWGQLFQIFSHSTHERRTFFFELIERQGARTFGSGNIKALYEALNDEQSSGSDCR